MRPSFIPRLVHEKPFGDPGLFIPFAFDRRALLFDLGDLSPLSPRDLLKVSHVFVTHTHMDHFIGFDALLRVTVGREKDLVVYGPLGILDNLAGKLAGYTWNLVENYENPFTLTGVEVSGAGLKSRRFRLHDGFVPDADESAAPFEGVLLDEAGFFVEAAILDHKIPCLGFTLVERVHINILKERLTEMGLVVGAWLKDLKDALHQEIPPDTRFTALQADGGTRSVTLGEMAESAVKYTPGQKIAYVTDAAPTPANLEKIRSLCRDADLAVIEAAFLDEDMDAACEKHHLTARLAGTAAREAGAKRIEVFHFSPRYTDRPEALREEAMAAFSGDLS